jgi:SMC interacting uncharacterized protein involved in chromosome segregation
MYSPPISPVGSPVPHTLVTHKKRGGSDQFFSSKEHLRTTQKLLTERKIEIRKITQQNTEMQERIALLRDDLVRLKTYEARLEKREQIIESLQK